MIVVSFTLRVLLVFFAFVVFYFVIRKLKKAQMQVLDSLFWLLFSTSFVLLGVFPNIAVRIAGLLGFMSASNFVFLYVIAVLVVRDFTISVRLAKQEERLNSLVQAAALHWNSIDSKSSNSDFNRND